MAALAAGGAAARAATALGDPGRAARPLVGEITGLRERFQAAGCSRVVLVADAATGLAAEALTAAAGLPATRLVVLDSPDPGRVGEALSGDLDATLLVVSARGATATTVLLRDTVAGALRADGHEPAGRTVVVAAPDDAAPDDAADGEDTCPRVALYRDALATGTTVVLGEAWPEPGLTAHALVPTGLAGADPGAVLADAAAARAAISADHPDNPALELGTRLAGARTVALVDDGDGLATWAAQRIAAATGPHGPMPMVLEAAGAPGWDDADLAVGLGAGSGADRWTEGACGAQLMLWCHATMVAAGALGTRPVPPLTGPDRATPTEPVLTEGAVEVFAGPWLPAGTQRVADALRALVAAVTDGGELALRAHLDREGDASLAVLRTEIARRTGRTTTFGWAPRCPPAAGALCQLTGAPDPDVAAGLAGLGGALDALLARQAAHARAEAAAATGPVLRLHLTDRVAGLVTVARAVQEL